MAFHRLIARYHIFDYTCQNVSDMWFAVGCRRTIVKCEYISIFMLVNLFFEYIVFFPEFFNLFFAFHEIKIGIYLVVHRAYPPSK